MAIINEVQLTRIARRRGVVYRAIPDSDPKMVRTFMSRKFPIPQVTMFQAFSDPVAHVRLFSIIKSSTPPIRYGIEQILAKNQFLAFEHVQESNLPARLMLVKYTLYPPRKILKEAVTDPFMEGRKGGRMTKEDLTIMDKKAAKVVIKFEKISKAETRIVTESSFRVETGAVFTRKFIDHVWLNFYERMLVANGQISESEMLT